MKLIPLLDRTGTTKAWADRQTDWISDLTGKVLALVRSMVFSTEVVPKSGGGMTIIFQIGTVM